jgi:branched-chain amino acid transport system ATP-binding protein
VTDARPAVRAAGSGVAAESPAVPPVALRVRDIEVRFAGITALGGVSAEVRHGEMLGLIGPNGAGKTTLFDTICGLRLPNSGVVELNGHNVSTLSTARRARLGLRRTFQRQQVFGSLSVEDNLLCACEWRGGGGGVVADLVGWPARKRHEATRRAALEIILERCGLTALRRQPAGSLPIGKARMLELGRALADGPSVLLLDEPTSGLGEDDVALMASVIDQIKAAGECAVVLVEHDIGFVMTHADRVVCLVRGQVIAAGSPAEVQRDEQVRAAYLG